jgi:uncharacterized protein (DUF427 family)
MKVERARPGPGQESVWDYPRPPRLEPCARRIVVVFRGITLVDTLRAQRVLETSHPPVYCLPREDIRMEHLRPVSGSSLCEWKGWATYFDVVVGPHTAPRAAWSYPDPTPAFAAIRGHLAFYAGPMDACTVDGERVTPQPGGFYGGWITGDVVGPFKGVPGSSGW